VRALAHTHHVVRSSLAMLLAPAHDLSTRDGRKRELARLDAALNVTRNPEHTISQVLVHRAVGTAKNRRRIPRSRYPKSIEVSYATQLVGMVNAAKQHVAAAMTQIPKLLADHNRQDRADDGGGVFLSRELEAVDDRPYKQLVRFAGLPIVVENPVGSVRYWIDSFGVPGSTTMQYAYGYIAGTEGADSEETDVYLGPDENADDVFVVHQMCAPDFETYDEDKVMLGFPSASSARDAYLAQYTDPRFLGSMDTVSLADFKSSLLARCDRLKRRRYQIRRDAGEPTKAARLVADARKRFSNAVNPGTLDTLARKMARATTDAQRVQLAAQTKAALGVNITTLDKSVPKLVDGFAAENVALIKSLSNKTFDDVEKAVTRAFTSGASADDLSDELQDRFGIAERHARLIARDQIGKLNGQVTAARHQELGVKSFTWRTAGDDRVRPEHEDLDGQSFTYDDPPSEGLPGEPVCCRCSAEPDFGGLLDDIDKAGADEDEDE